MIRLDVRRAIFLIISFILNGVQQSNLDTFPGHSSDFHRNTSDALVLLTSSTSIPLHLCPSNLMCKELNYPCIVCDEGLEAIKDTCVYGENYNVTCKVRPGFKCKGAEVFNKTATCRYCYQLENWEIVCKKDKKDATCNSVSSPKQYFKAECEAVHHIICLGKSRSFRKKFPCKWTGGHRWITALTLSITLGGFGADRFYLGHWQEAIGKLFSFGGLGVWTLIDVILISIHYLGPADGSLYL